MSHQYLKDAGESRNATPQSEPIPGREIEMAKNNAGGFVFTVDNWERLRRFLILGSEGGSYYATQRKMTTDNIKAVEECLTADGLRFVRQVVSISKAGRAPKNDPAIYCLAMAAGSADQVTRKAALDALPDVCRIGTHLFHFAEFVEKFRGWGRGLKEAFGRWYTGRTLDALMYQLVKYRQRDGWSHRDIFRLAHPRATEPGQGDIFGWVTHRGNGTVADGDHKKRLAPILTEEKHKIIWAFEQVQKLDVSKKDDFDKMVALIGKYKLPWETLPTEALNDARIQGVLLPHMGITAIVRNLGNYTKSGLLKPLSKAVSTVVEKLTNTEDVRKSRVHPIQILTALMTYGSGKSVRGSGEWTPVQAIVDALDESFYLAFDNIEKTDKRIVLAMDVSGSMQGTWSGNVAGVPGLSPAIAAAAMAMVTAKAAKHVTLIAFSSIGSKPSGFSGRGGAVTQVSVTGITDVKASKRTRLDDVVAEFAKMPMSGGTDCSLPMLWASEHGIEADAFVLYTDNETWAGEVHASQRLAQYRKKTGIPAKMVVVGMTATEFTVADPNDAGQMDVVGFDTAAPAIINDFIDGKSADEEKTEG